MIKRVFAIVKNWLWCKWAEHKLRKMYRGCYREMEKANSAVFDLCGGFLLDNYEMAKLCYDCPHYVGLGSYQFCEGCARFHTMDCPNSGECFSIPGRPYFVPKMRNSKG